jgi:hypothetical protein
MLQRSRVPGTNLYFMVALLTLFLASIQHFLSCNTATENDRIRTIVVQCRLGGKRCERANLLAADTTLRTGSSDALSFVLCDNNKIDRDNLNFGS